MVWKLVAKFFSVLRCNSYFDKIVARKVHEYFVNEWSNLKVDRTKKPRLFFGPDPIINFSYWATAMKAEGFDSKSVMTSSYSINKEEDFDILLNRDSDVILRSERLKGLDPFLQGRVISHYWSYLCFDYIISNFDIFHISYVGFGILPEKYWMLEIDLIKQKGAQIIILPYGSDWIQYSKYSNSASFKHGLLAHYPHSIAGEERLEEKISFLNKKANIIVAGGNLVTKVWHVLSCNYIIVDEERFNKEEGESDKPKSGKIIIAHSPNHRLIKGTEYLIEAVEQLIREGYNIELLLLEKMKNDDVLMALKYKADILVDQLLSGYALSAIEGMACGLPVISNMEDTEYDRKVLRRFSYLDECPILSATPETIKENLKYLVKNPALVKQLGSAGREYVLKYHSRKAAQFLFNSIYDKIWFEKEVDLMSLYHPILKDSYNNRSAKVDHPLVENKIPQELLSTLNK